MKVKLWMMAAAVAGVMGLSGVILTPTVGQRTLAQQSESSVVDSSSIEGKLDSNSQTMEDESYFNVHTFQGKAGEPLIIDLTSKDFDAYIILVDPNNNKIAENDDGGDENNARIVLTLPVTGTYTLIVNSAKAKESGSYVLSWREATERDIALAEAERLNQQVIQLYQQGKYNEAIPLAEQALAIRKKVLGDNHLDTATSLNNLALVYHSQGRYPEAEPLFQQALAIRKAQLGDNNPATASSLNNLAALYYSEERYTEAEPLLKEALAIRKAQLGDTHPDVATTLNNLASLYQSQERYAEAEPLIKEALAIRKAQLGNNHPDTAQSLNNLALLYQSQGRYSEAELLYQQSLAILKQQLGSNHPYVAFSLINLALLYHIQGRFKEEEPLLQQSLVIRKQQLGDNHLDVAESLNNLAYLYMTLGKYAEAEPLYRESLAIRKQQLGDNHPDTVISLNNLAGLYKYQGRYAEAEPLYRESLAIRKQQLGDNHPDTAISLNNLGELYRVQGRYTEAKTLLQQALAIFKKQLGDDHLNNMATSLNNLALLYKSQGRYSEAEPLYKEALAITKRQVGDNHPDTAISLNNLAALYDSQGRYSEAESLFKQALAIRKQQLGDNHPSTATSLNNLAGLYWSQDDIPQAINYLSQGLAVEEYNLLENLKMGDDKQKQDYMAKVLGTTNSVISLNLQAVPNNPEATRLALKTILERKGRILDVSTNSLQILRQRTDDLESQQLLTQLIEVRTQLSNLTFKKPEDIKNPEIYRQQINEVTEKAKEIEGKIGVRSAEFRSLSQPITLEGIQKLIPADAALVEIVRYQPFNPKAPENQRFGNPRYAVYILYPNGDIKAKDLGEAKPIDDKLIYFRDNLADAQTPLPQLQKSARQLDEELMQPIRQLLGNTKTILLSPDAALNLIPFEALVDENNQYLVENYHITYLTSGRDLLRLKDKFASQQSPLIVADPFYGKAGEKVALTRSIDLSEFTFPGLPGTEEEAKAIKNLLPQSTVLTGSQATENAIKQVKKPNILHIATHGFFKPERNLGERNSGERNSGERNSGERNSGERNSPLQGERNVIENPLLRSGLVLAGVTIGQSAGDDGVLTALETTNLNLVGTKLVVLSACDTGKGDIKIGQGVYGLRRALVIAGSESQLISLWKVSDDATKDLMVAYYGRLQKGEGRSEALRQIQLGMLKGEKQKHPFYWASFIPSGDATSMQFD
ncbi:MAG: tetratricopeptide repeat protein [Microcystis aeruginosa Ma_MB_F_20061100_S20]|uniref:Tetratricopeptide repeat protein n=1 Tax=Microcystis aeruginosa Ma_MB_F_20061100_S20D TaxID=2486253 RepID=A0A552E997_MICAE|nr:MAG: tetratricopeptide repeat protein [Microcystis aeruginosa Ma_MB_F_20061100_S20D]TRU41183.1 MAG: tetratricopeptide repeat protein [Microcystis aeruginosa Ma_MB_F_20061100_S20]